MSPTDQLAPWEEAEQSKTSKTDLAPWEEAASSAPATASPAPAPPVATNPNAQLPNGTMGAAPKPGWSERARQSVANSVVGRSINATMPGVSEALHLQPTESENSPTYQQDKESLPQLPDWANKPLITPETALPAPIARSIRRSQTKLEQAHPVAGGVLRGAEGVAEGLTGPANLALLAAAPEAKPLMALFAAQAAQGSYDDAEQAYQAYRSGNNPEAAKFATQSGLSAIIAGLAGRSAVKGAFPVDTGRPSVSEPRVQVPQEPRGLPAPPQPEYVGEPAAPAQAAGIPDAEVTPWVEAQQAQLTAKAGEGRSPSPPLNRETAVERTKPPAQFNPPPEIPPDRGVIVDQEGRALVNRPELPPPGETAKRKSPIIAKPVPPPAPQQAPTPQLGSAATMARPIVQQSGNPEELRESAQEQKPALDEMATAVTQAVPGAEVVGPRVKSEDSIENKDERGKAPETNIDNLGVRVVAPNPDAVPAVQAAVERELPVISKDKIENNGLNVPQYGVKTGKPGEPNQVSELQVIPSPEVADAMKATDDLYAKQKEAIANGNKAEADRLGEQIQSKLQEAQQQSNETVRKGGRGQSPEPVGQEVGQSQQLAQPEIKKIAKGARVTLPNGSMGTVKHINPNYSNGGRVIVQPDEYPKSEATYKGDQLKPEQSAEPKVAPAAVPANEPQPEAKGDKWIGVDLDGTLAQYDGFKGKSVIGEPIPQMVTRVKQWLAGGNNVRILTARVSEDPGGEARKAIDEWTAKHLGQKIPVTDVKDSHMVHLYDDRAVPVERNTGRLLANIQPETEERRQTPQPAGEPRERRTDPEKRKAIDEMSLEEAREAIRQERASRRTSEVTGLPNRIAFDEAERENPSPAIGMSDSDGLKAFNDKFNYESGNNLLRAKAEALKQAGLEAYHDKGDEFLYRGESAQSLMAKLADAREILRGLPIFAEMKDGTVKQFKGADFSYGTGKDLKSAEQQLKLHKSDREAAGERGRGELRGIAEVGSEAGKGGESGTETAKFKFGNTQADIPAGSEAANALVQAQKAIDPADLATGEINGTKNGIESDHHVTVRYGIQGEDTAGIRAYLEKQAPFEATLGKTQAFPPSEHSDGAAPIIAPVESADLRRMEKELDKHGDFKERSFPEYKPHATVAYVKADAAKKYVGMTETEGKTFTVSSISISKKDGSSESVQLKGAHEPERAEQTRDVATIFAGDSTDPIAVEAKRATKALTGRVSDDLETWLAAGTESGGRLDENFRENRPEAKELYDAFSGVRKMLRERFGKEVTLYRSEPVSLEGKRTRAILAFADSKMIDAIARGSSDRILKVQVPIDEIVAVPAGIHDTDYREFIVKNDAAVQKARDEANAKLNRAEQPTAAVANRGKGEEKHAVQIEGPARLDERQPQEVGEAGRERGRVEPVEQGTEPAGESAVEKQGGEKDVQKEVITPKAQFNEVYERKLKEAHAQYPDRYKWPAENVPSVAQKMTEAMAKGTANMDSPAIKAALRELGVKPTRKAVAEYFAQSEAPPARPLAHRGAVLPNVEIAKPAEQAENVSREHPQDHPARTAGKAEDLPSVPEPKSEGGDARATVPATRGGEAEGERRPRGSAGPADTDRMEHPGGEPEERDEHDRSRGTSVSEHPAPEREGVLEHPERPEEAQKTVQELRNQRNFHISDEYAKEVGAGGEKTKIRQNLDALELLKKIQEEGREVATPDEQEILSKYVDFGGLVAMLENPYEKEYSKHYERFKTILSPEEIQEIKETLPNTHYTSMRMVDFVWNAIKRMGFKGGRILEPGMGIGNFFGRMPEKISDHSELFGVERNPLTGSMAKLLYPDAKIVIKPFQQFLLPDNSLNLAIGNVPFQDFDVTDDPIYRKLKLRLHNYFIVKALDKIRPGGIAALITTRYTMDNAQGQGQRAREEMFKRADLLTAIRLPNSAFKGNAGTEVVADLLVLRKRAPGDVPAEVAPWVKTGMVKVPGQEPIIKKYTSGWQHGEYVENAELTKEREFPVNQFFIDHPENVIGTHSQAGKMYRKGEYTVTPPKDFDEALEKAIDLIPKNVYGKVKQAEGAQRPTDLPPATQDPEALEFAPEDLKPGSYYIDPKGTIRIKRSGVGAALPEELSGAFSQKQIRHAIDLRDQLNRTIQTQLSTAEDEPVARQQKELNKLYDSYRRQYGSLAGPKLHKLFSEDPEYPKLLALENVDPESKEISKAAIFSKRVLAPYDPLRDLPEDPKTAMLKVIAEKGKLDTGLMADLLKRPENEVIESLRKEGLIYEDPRSGRLETEDEYLSGPVREKLKEAKNAADSDPKYKANVDALEKVQPKTLDIHEIQPNLGATWIPEKIVKGFIKHLAGDGRWKELNISRNLAGKWLVQVKDPPFDLREKWGAGGIPGHKLVQYAMNQQMPTVYTSDGKGGRVFDAVATTAARDKLNAIREEFRTVIRRAPQGIIDELEQIYNDTFGGYRQREFSGEHLTFPGMAEEWKEKMRTYQRSAVWRIIQEGRGGIFHAPGLGKTLSMIAGGMEAKRLGLSRKNFYAVPNNMIPQWRESFKKVYPNANILAVQDEDFASATARARLMSRIATGDWDAVIIPHSQFDLLPMSPEWEKRTLDGRLADYRRVLEDLDEEDKDDKKTIKQIEKAMDKLESRLNDLNAKKKDNTIHFDEMGVDMLFVDEAHAYKAMAVPTKISGIGGVSSSASERALAMEIKADYMRDTHGGRGLVFATGTPVTNTLGEVYVMTKYLAPELLEEAGIKNFDDWVAQFATAVTQWEYGPDGVTFRPKTTLSEFVNVPELASMFQKFAEYISKEQAKKLSNLVEPEAKRVDHTVKITPVQEPLLEWIAKRGEQLIAHPPRTKEEKQADNWLKLSTDAKKASLDPRLINPKLKDDPNSKANQTVKVAAEILHRTKAERGTVLIFTDLFQHTDPDGRPDFNLFEDMRKKLVKEGIPASEVAIAHEAKNDEQKEAMFAKMRQGKIRVMFGTTEKMGIGVNVQDRLKALFHLDQPYRPDQVEQREGRIIRSGNTWNDVEIHRFIAEPQEGKIKTEKVTGYETKDGKQVPIIQIEEKERPRAYDLQMYQILARKADFQEQFLTGNYRGRTMEDTGGEVRLNSQIFALGKAMATGNPDAMKKLKLDNDRRTYDLLERNFQITRSQNTRKLEYAKMRIATEEHNIKMADQTKAIYDEHATKTKDGWNYDLTVNGKDMKGAEAAAFASSNPPMDGIAWTPVKIAGFDVQVKPAMIRHWTKDENGKEIQEVAPGFQYSMPAIKIEDRTIDPDEKNPFKAMLTSAGNSIRSAIDFKERYERWLKEAQDEKAGLERELANTSPYIQKLEGIEKEIAEIDKRLGVHGSGDVDEGAEADEGEDMPTDGEAAPREKKPAAQPKKNDLGSTFHTGFADPELFMRLFPSIAERIGKWAGDVETPANEQRAMMRESRGQMDRRVAIAIHKLSDAAKEWRTRSREDSTRFWNAVEGGRVDTLPAKDQALANVFSAAFDQLKAEIQELKPEVLQNYIENYFPHIWEKPSQVSAMIKGLLTGKRPFAGRAAFLKKRTIPTMQDGLDLGLKPKSWNPVDSFMLKYSEMAQYLMGYKTLATMKDAGTARYVRVGAKAPEGWMQLDDRISTVYGNPEIPVKEAFDKHVWNALMETASNLLTQTTRKTSIGGTRLGYYSRLDGIVTKANVQLSVLAHELGHAIDEIYGLKNQLVKDPAYKKELRNLADLRIEDEEGVSDYYKRYIRKGEEKMAAIFEAYVHAPERFEEVAPNTYKHIKEFIAEHQELEPLKNLKRGLTYESRVNTVNAGGAVIKGHYYAPAEAARVFNNFVSKGIAGRSGIYDAVNWLNQNLNALQLGVSAFHAATTSINAATSDVALGIQQLAEGKPFQAGYNMAKGLTGAPSILRTLVNGTHLMKQYLNPGSYAKMEFEARALAEAGGRITQNTIEIKPLEKIINAWRNGAVLEGLTPIPSAILHATVAPVMNYYVPRMKLGAFYAMAHNILEESDNRNWSEETTRARMQEAWDSIDNRFGQVVYDNLFWHKAMRDVLQLATRSVGWNFGSVREIGGGIKDTAQNAARVAAGKAPRVTPRMAFTIALPIVSALIGGLLNYLWTGKKPETWKDYFYPQTANGERHSIPGYMKDVFSFAHAPVRTALNKMAPIWSLTADAIQNRDFYSTEIRHLDDPFMKQLQQFALWAAKQPIPFSFSGAGKLLKEHGAGPSLSEMLSEAKKHPGDVALGQLGFQPAPAFIQNSPAMSLAREYSMANRPPGTKTAEQNAHYEAMASVAQMYRNNDVNQEQIDRYVNEGVLTDKDVDKAVRESDEIPIARVAKNLTIEQLLNVWDKASPDEKDALEPILARRERKIDEVADEDERDKLYKAFDKAMSETSAPATAGGQIY